MRPGERHCLLHPPHHPCPAPLIPTIPLYNIPKSGSHLTRKRAHLGNAGSGVAIAFGLTASLAATGASGQATLNKVKQKGFLVCGSNPALPRFGMPDAQGNWTGFDIDYCRAFAAAIFNDPTKVRFIPLSAKDRFTALQSGEIDVLVRNSTWTMSRDTQLGLDFPAVNYYDGQGFM